MLENIVLNKAHYIVRLFLKTLIIQVYYVIGFFDKMLTNLVYYIEHFLYHQARLIRENDKNGNFRHFPQLDRLEGYKNVRENIVRNKAIS